MEFLSQPKPVEMKGDLSQNWTRFRKNFVTYLVATGCKEKSKQIQRAVLLHCMGDQAREIYETLDIIETDDIDQILQKMDEYFLPKINTSIERNKFNNRVQGPGEMFDSFLADLRKIASNCDYGQMKDSLITDRIICGIKNKTVKDRLLREQNINLKKATDICKAAEQTEAHIKELAETTGMQTNQVLEVRSSLHKKKPAKEKPVEMNQWGRSNSYYNQSARSGNSRQRNSYDDKTYTRRNQGQQDCSRCGLEHWGNKCPAQGKMCSLCKKKQSFC
jgi:hypothetical protein